MPCSWRVHIKGSVLLFCVAAVQMLPLMLNENDDIQRISHNLSRVHVMEISIIEEISNRNSWSTCTNTHKHQLLTQPFINICLLFFTTCHLWKIDLMSSQAAYWQLVINPWFELQLVGTNKIWAKWMSASLGQHCASPPGLTGWLLTDMENEIIEQSGRDPM